MKNKTMKDPGDKTFFRMQYTDRIVYALVRNIFGLFTSAIFVILA